MLRQLQPQDPAFVPLKLEEVSNPLARQWLQHLYKTAAPVLALGKEEYYPFTTEDSTVYRRWVRKKLREGAFFGRLSGGLEGLPDIRDAIHPLLRPLHDITRPKDSLGTIEHVVRNLEWYLDSSRRTKVGKTLWLPLAWIGSISVMVAWIMWIYSISPLTSLIVATSFCLSTLSAGRFLVQTLGIGEERGSWKYQVNSVELYRYLLELHSEEAEPASEPDARPTEQPLSAIDVCELHATTN